MQVLLRAIICVWPWRRVKSLRCVYMHSKQWNVDVINVKVNLRRSSEIPAGPNTFYCEVNVSGDMDEDQKKRLLQIAKACPVSRLLGKINEGGYYYRVVVLNVRSGE